MERPIGGTCVRLVGLKARSDINGFHATVVAPASAEESEQLVEKGRIKVRTAHEALSVRLENIVALDDKEDGDALFSNETFAVVKQLGGFGVVSRRLIAHGDDFWCEQPLAVQTFSSEMMEDPRFQQVNADLASVVAIATRRGAVSSGGAALSDDESEGHVSSLPGIQCLADKAMAITASVTFPKLAAGVQRRYMGLSDCLVLWPWKIQVGTDPESGATNGECWDLATKSPAGILQTNGIRKELPEAMDSSCTLVFELMSRFNHSCVPNCGIRINASAEAHDVTVTALRDIPPGEALCINYGTDPRTERFAAAEARRAYLRSKYNFDCACELCGPVSEAYRLQQRDKQQRRAKEHEAVLAELAAERQRAAKTMAHDAPPARPLPPPPSPLTSEWLRAVGIAAEIESAEPLLGGNNSTCSRLLLVGGDRLVVKRPPVRAAVVGVARTQRWLEREHRFYRELAPLVPMRTPRCRFEQGEGGFDPHAILLLEELSCDAGADDGWVEPSAGDTSFAQARAAVTALGAMHGRFIFHEAKALGAAQAAWLPRMPIRSELAAGVAAYYSNVAWPTVQRAYANELAAFPRVIALAERMADPVCYVALQSKLSEPPLTLVHGDYRPDNLRWHRSSGACAAFDWQFVAAARGAVDLSYFLALALAPEERRAHEAELRAAYEAAHAAERAASGPPGGATDRACDDADLCAGLCIALASFIMGAATAEGEEARRIHSTAITRIAHAAIDWGAECVL